MRRRLLPVVAALGLLAACGPSDAGPDIQVSAATEAKARLLANVTGPVGWTAQDNKVRAVNMKRYELGSVPLVIDTDGGVSVGYVSPDLDEAALYRTGCEAARAYLDRVQAAIAADAPGTTFAFSVDDCAAALARTTTEDGSAIGARQTVPVWTGGANGAGTERYLVGVLRLGGAGNDARQLNTVVGWTPKGV